MLEITFDLKNGTHDAIPHDIHYLKLTNITKLTTQQQTLLRQWIVKHQLDISLYERILVSPLNSEAIVKQLTQFVQLCKTIQPKKRDMSFGWLLIVIMFALPVWGAYHFSAWLQTAYVEEGIQHLAKLSLFSQHWVNSILFGDYGIGSLGTYSLIWALPVVILISLSTAIVAQTHLKEYIVWAIEPTMKKLGLHGADIIPVLEGFGCNAAAVSQAASQCHQCTKAQCMSLISFGSSCSYQIGATLSIFNVAQRSWLFVPYLILVFLGGMLHNQLWRNRQQQRLITNSNFCHNFKFHWPQFFSLCNALWCNVRMFLLQALPIFIGICVIVSLLALTPILTFISQIFMPLLSYLNIPTQLSPGILFSIIRKDGMLLFNMHDGFWLKELSSLQLLLLVFFSSTFTSCTVTMTMLIRHLGWLQSLKMISQQMITASMCITVTWFIVRICTIWLH